MDYVTKFNDTFQELVDDLAKTFPEDQDLEMYTIAIQAAVFANKNLLVEVFRDKVSDDWKGKILERDESFFLKTDYKDCVDGLDNSDLSIITKLKQYWHKLEEVDKETVWKYLRVIVLLHKKICI
jgi:hypothetical protein